MTSFEQVTDPAEAEFTISLASPPTADQLCLPARTQVIWGCRVGPGVVLNSGRWIYMTPTYTEIGEYRAYMVNHEVGHFLGHGHESCGGEGLAAPAMSHERCTDRPVPFLTPPVSAGTTTVTPCSDAPSPARFGRSAAGSSSPSPRRTGPPS